MRRMTTRLDFKRLGHYGSLSIDRDTGEWTTRINNDADATQRLNNGQTEPKRSRDRDELRKTKYHAS